MESKEVRLEELFPLSLRPVIGFRVEVLKESIKKNGYDPACPLVVQKNGSGYLVVNGCHRLQAARELGLDRLPVVEFPPEEDPVKLALRTQENDENVQPWDFLDRAFLVKRLYEELGTQERVAERLGWERSNVSRYLAIASLPGEVVTVIRSSVTVQGNSTVTEDCDRGHRKNLDDLWSVRWFRHICSLPADELKLAVVKKIAEAPEKWKEKDVASECARLKKRHELSTRIKEVLEGQESCEKELVELLDAVKKGVYDDRPEKALERADAVLKARQRTDLELMQEFGYEPEVFTVWRFNGRDERFGQKHPGNIPAGIVFNVLYYWSEQGDLVIDPMAGGGVVIDVCRAMKRRCVAWDVHPVREDVVKHDATRPWPVEPGSAALVFIDPPYWKQKRGEYRGENNLADMDLEGFYRSMRVVFEHAKRSLRPGGHLAVIVGPTQEAGRVHDHALVFARLLEDVGFEYVNRVIVPYTTQQVTGFDVAQARKSRFLLKLHRDLLVYRKAGD
ncbi:ParB/RepB/Spo0J family partition protein [Ammonifex thiophilus]|uniref:ParB/RepB/Spo0J family partition protein n=1 Tax=Ammonifex thiophilus TaxID=444093 RepID=UPI001402A695|nr:DNA methyltransferase [Ammonifex thiophilus]